MLLIQLYLLIFSETSIAISKIIGVIEEINSIQITQKMKFSNKVAYVVKIKLFFFHGLILL